MPPRREEFARRIAEEAAKPIATARVEIDRACDTFRFSAAVARTLTGETVPMDASTAGAHKLGIVLRVPIGVVGAISPFNFPVNLVVHKIGPAIAAGCPVVLKPASATPLSALARGLVVEPGALVCRGHARLLAHSLWSDDDVLEVEMDVREGRQELGVE